MGYTTPELVWEDGLMMFQGSGIKGMPIGPGNPHQSALPFLTTNPTTLLPMSSVTFFESSDCKNTQRFWEGVSSGPATQSPKRHPSTCPVFARLDTPTPTHWGQGPKYPPGTCWIHWEYRQQVTPMCPVGKSWVY